MRLLKLLRREPGSEPKVSTDISWSWISKAKKSYFANICLDRFLQQVAIIRRQKVSQFFCSSPIYSQWADQVDETGVIRIPI